MRHPAMFKVALTSALLLAPIFAEAAQSLPYGWYLEADAGSAKLTDQNTASGVDLSGSGVGINANLGYKLMPFLGIEIGYTSYPNSAWTISSSDTKIGDSSYYSYDAAFRGIIPVANSGLEAFAKAGIGRIASHLSITNSSAATSAGVSGGTHSATGLFTGIGIQYNLTPGIALLGEWTDMRGNNNTGNEQLLSAGMSLLMS